MEQRRFFAIWLLIFGILGVHSQFEADSQFAGSERLLCSLKCNDEPTWDEKLDGIHGNEDTVDSTSNEVLSSITLDKLPEETRRHFPRKNRKDIALDRPAAVLAKRARDIETRDQIFLKRYERARNVDHIPARGGLRDNRPTKRRPFVGLIKKVIQRLKSIRGRESDAQGQRWRESDDQGQQWRESDDQGQRWTENDDQDQRWKESDDQGQRWRESDDQGQRWKESDDQDHQESGNYRGNYGPSFLGYTGTLRTPIS